MRKGLLPGVGVENSLICPAGVMRPILLVVQFPLSSNTHSVNQRLPSGPLVMPIALSPCGRGNSVSFPAGVMRPIWPFSPNQRLPSGPVVICVGSFGAANSVMVPAGGGPPAAREPPADPQPATATAATTSSPMRSLARNVYGTVRRQPDPVAYTL